MSMTSRTFAKWWNCRSVLIRISWCGTADPKEALVVAAAWMPDFILLDVMMPMMDGPATLVQLRQNPRTAGIPVIFMTARAQAREVDRFRSLGAVGVIQKPFDPMTLAASVRSYAQPAGNPLDDLRVGFLQRLRRDAAALSEERLVLKDGNRSPDTLKRIRQLAHGLAGAAGIYGFAEISDVAAALEEAIVTEIDDIGPGEETDRALDSLVSLAQSCGDSGGMIVRPLQEA